MNRDINDELKIIKETVSNKNPTLAEIEAIAEKISTENYNKYKIPNLKIARMFPECYANFTFNNINVQNFHEETLFFIFYSLVESDLQLQAYNELIKKGYYYSKTLDGFVFFEESLKISDNRRKKIQFFDIENWEKQSKEVVFDDAFINSLQGKILE